MTEIAPKIRAELEALYQSAMDAGKLLTPDQVNAYQAHFREEFGPDRLLQLDGEALLQRMHGGGSKTSLVYWLEFKHDDEFPTQEFGRIGGGSAAKFGIYQRADTNQWVTGAGKHQQILSTEAAVARARRHREQLVKAVETIAQLPMGAEDSAYVALQKELDRVAPDLVDTAWGHKYLSLLYGNKIDDFHVRPYQDWNLMCLLQPPPETAGRFVCAGRFMALARTFGWNVYATTSVLGMRHGAPVNHFVVDIRHLGSGGLEALLAQSVLAFPGAAAGNLVERAPSEAWKAALRKRVARAHPELGARDLDRKTTELGWFAYELQRTSYVLVVDGQDVLAVGKIEGDYRFVAGDLPHQRPVTWLTVGRFRLPTAESIGGTFDRMTRVENVIAVRRALLESTPPGPPPIVPPPPRVVGDGSDIPQRRAAPPLSGVRGRVQAILERKGQAILYGPPGTGKTHWAERTACDLAAWEQHGRLFDELDEEAREAIRGPAGRIRLCTFHPSYGYEDFIEGYRPEPKATGMSFERRDGVFKRLCKDAAASAERWTHYLIVDEINRGDVPRIFGELLTLLELDKRGRTALLPSGEAFSVPLNVRVIGTMNTADRSIALLDAALRRRFGFVELMPEPELLDRTVVKPALPLGGWLRRLNRRILQHVKRDARNLQIGHAYFLDRGQPIESPTRFAQILREDVIPLLEEYCYADFHTLAELVGPRIVNVEAQQIRDELFTADRATELVETLLALDPDLAATNRAVEAEDQEGPDADASSESDELPGAGTRGTGGGLPAGSA